MSDAEIRLYKFLEGEGDTYTLVKKDLAGSFEMYERIKKALLGLDQTQYTWTEFIDRVEVRRLSVARTETVFKGKPDERQGGDIKPTMFRPRYRALTVAEKELHDDIKSAADYLYSLYQKIDNPGRYRALAATALEESVMWAVKELTK